MVTVIVCSYLFLKIPNIHGFENLQFQMFSAPGLSAHPNSACPLQKHPGFLQLFPCSFQEARNHQQRFVVVQSLSRVRLCATPQTAACQASLSLTICRNLLKPMSIELVMPSNHLILCRLPLLPPVNRGYSLCSWFGTKLRISLFFLFLSLPSHLSLLPPSPTRETTQNVRP